MECTKCGSSRVEKRNLGAKIGGGLGALAGGLGALVSSNIIEASSNVFLAIMPGVGDTISEISKAIIGFLSGAAGGGGAGGVSGMVFDKYVLDSYKCNDCGHTFDIGSPDDK